MSVVSWEGAGEVNIEKNERECRKHKKMPATVWSIMLCLSFAIKNTREKFIEI